MTTLGLIQEKLLRRSLLQTLILAKKIFFCLFTDLARWKINTIDFKGTLMQILKSPYIFVFM